MKKPISVAVAFILTLFSCSTLYGCDTSPVSAGLADGGMRIVVVTCPAGVDDGSFNQYNYEGVTAYIDENPLASVEAVREPDIANAISAIENVVADYDVVVLLGYQFAGVYQIASDNPDTYFILVDAFPADENGTVAEADNVFAMMFADQESGFFAGIAAALETSSGQVASIHGIAYPNNVNYQMGFESGVVYANKNLGTQAESIELPSYAGTDVSGANIGGNYVGSFSDEATGKIVAESLIKEGVDIILTAAGESGNGAFTAIKESSATDFVIGSDYDQFDEGVNGSENIVLTSVIKRSAESITKLLEAIEDGTFTGGNYVLDASTDSTGYISDPGRQQLSDSSLDILHDIYLKVKAGDIVVPSVTNGTTPQDFVGL